MPKVYACQLDCVWHSPAANHDAAQTVIAAQSVVAGSLVVLPEMFDVGFSMDGQVACAAAATTQTFLARIARDTKSTVLAGHAMCDVAGRPVNQTSVFDASGARVSQYVKCHGFTPAGEHNTYTPGDGATVFD